MKKLLPFLIAGILTGCTSNKVVMGESMAETEAYVNAKLLEGVESIQATLAEVRASKFGTTHRDTSDDIDNTVVNKNGTFKKNADSLKNNIKKDVKDTVKETTKTVTATTSSTKEKMKEIAKDSQKQVSKETKQVKDDTSKVVEQKEYLNKLITPVDVQYSGKASTLLSQLANNTGYKFNSVGEDLTRVSINSKGTVQDVLAEIATKTKGVADIKVNTSAKTITLINK